MTKTKATASSKKKKSISPNPDNKSHSSNLKIKYSIGGLLVLFSFYLVIAFFSFTFFGGADHSLLQVNSAELLSDASINVKNWGEN